MERLPPRGRSTYCFAVSAWEARSSERWWPCPVPVCSHCSGCLSLDLKQNNKKKPNSLMWKLLEGERFELMRKTQHYKSPLKRKKKKRSKTKHLIPRRSWERLQPTCNPKLREQRWITGGQEILIKAVSSLAFYTREEIIDSISFYETEHEARSDTHFCSATFPQCQNNPSRQQRAERCPRVYSEIHRCCLLSKI